MTMSAERHFDGDLRILQGATETALGTIPHLSVKTKFGTLRMPVRIVYDVRDTNGRPYPEVTRSGKYRYAYPGGGCITEEDVSCL